MRQRCTSVAISTLATIACATHLASAADTVQPSAAAHASADALAAVKHIYDPYADAAIDTPVLGNCFFRASGRPCPPDAAGAMTGALKVKLQRRARVQDADPVSCAQNTPQRVSYGVAFARPGTATIIVHTLYGDSGDNPISVDVDVHSLKLTAITCAPPAQSDRRVTTWSPFTPGGHLRAGLRTVSGRGFCIGTSVVPLATPAQRCFSKDAIRDPCFEPPGGIDAVHPTVLCAVSPWDHTVVRLHLIADAKNHQPAIPPAAFGVSTPRLPWAIRLATGQHCIFASGMTRVIAKRRQNYTCGHAPHYNTDHIHLFGSVERTHRIWKIQAANRFDAARLHPVVVAHIWR